MTTKTYTGAFLTTLVMTIVGCGAAGTEEEAFPTSEDEIRVSVGERLAGEYADGRGQISALSLKRTKVGSRFTFTFTAKERLACVNEPCPTRNIEGKWFANSTVLALDPTRGARLEYRYTLQSPTLTLRDPSGNVLASLNKRATTGTVAERVFADSGIPRAQLKINDADVRAQSALPNSVNYEDALRAGLKSFLTDNSSVDSPLSLVGDLELDELPAGCNATNNRELLLCYANSPTTEIGLMKLGDTAENGETATANWVFTMYLGNLSEAFHYAIVDRAGRSPVYNYGTFP